MTLKEYLEKYPAAEGEEMSSTPIAPEIWAATGVQDCAEIHDLADEICDLLVRFEELKWTLENP